MGGELPADSINDNILDEEKETDSVANEDLLLELDLEREKFAAEKCRADNL